METIGRAWALEFKVLGLDRHVVATLTFKKASWSCIGALKQVFAGVQRVSFMKVHRVLMKVK